MSRKIDNFCNIYDKDGKLLRHVDETGRLRNYTIEELEQYCETLDSNTDGYKNCVNMLVRWYQAPPTKKDREYVQAKQAELIKKVQEQSKQSKPVEEVDIEKALTDVEQTIEQDGEEEFNTRA